MRLVSIIKMIGRGLFVLTILSNCVLSLPLTPSQLENEDVKVMKCIVEALAEVLSRPHSMPVSQECLVTLKTDDRLVSILRHHNFLKELQEIAMQGGQERAELQRDDATPDITTQTPLSASDVADRSMLEALGGPGERSILSQKRRTGNGEERDTSLEDEESQEENDIAEEVQVKRENDEKPESNTSESVDEWSEGKAEKREEEKEEEEYEEKRAHSEKIKAKDKKGAGFGENRDAPRHTSKAKKFEKEEKEEKDKRSALFSHKQEEKQEEEEDEGETKRESKESPKRWTKRGKVLPLKRKAVGMEEEQQLSSQQEVPHHSKEISEEEEVGKKKRDGQRSPEEKELQMIARRGPEERRGLEEEGSASRKSEEPEIESLAAIESELENVAQKLHELRRG